MLWKTYWIASLDMEHWIEIHQQNFQAAFVQRCWDHWDITHLEWQTCYMQREIRGYHSSAEIAGGPHGSLEMGGPYGSSEIAGGPYGSLQTGGSHSSTVLIDGGLHSSRGGLGGYRSTREIAGGPCGSLQTGGSHSSTALIDGGGLYSSGGGLGGHRSTREIRGSSSSADMGEAGGHMVVRRAESRQIPRLSDYPGAATLTPTGEYAGLLMSPDLVGLTPVSGNLSLMISLPSLSFIAQYTIIQRPMFHLQQSQTFCLSDFPQVFCNMSCYHDWSFACPRSRSIW